MHYPLEVMLTCVRWYAAYPLSLRHIEEMMAERGVAVDHATVHRWALKILPVLAAVFRRRKRPVGVSWRMDETYIKVAGEWKYLYRAVDRDGHTIDFLLRAKRDCAAARRFLEHAIDLHGVPEKIAVDRSGANTAAIKSDQTRRATHAGVQEISLRSRTHRGHRNDAHDPQRAAQCLRRPSLVRSQPVLLAGFLSGGKLSGLLSLASLLRQNPCLCGVSCRGKPGDR